MSHFDAGRLSEHQSEEVRQGPGTRRAELGLVGVCLEPGNQLLRRLGRQVGADGKPEIERTELRDDLSVRVPQRSITIHSVTCGRWRSSTLSARRMCVSA